MITLNKKALELLDQIKASDELKEKTMQNILSKKKKSKSRILQYAIPACLIVIISGIFLFYPDQNNIIVEEQYSYIAIDINPSFELVLNNKDEVMDIKSYNEDAEVILQGLTIQGMSYALAMEEIITSLSNNQYLDQSSYLQVSVYSKDANRMQEIETAISSYLDNNIQSPHDCMHVDENTHMQAENHQMSFGKFDIASAIVGLSDDYTLEDLNKIPMVQLREIYASLTGDTWGGGNHKNCDNSHKKQPQNRKGHQR